MVDTDWVYYKETYCADIWTNDDLKEIDEEKNIEAYFKSIDIKILEIQISNDSVPELCKACFCKTGRIIKCKVKTKDVAEMQNKGFYQ